MIALFGLHCTTHTQAWLICFSHVCVQLWIQVIIKLWALDVVKQCTCLDLVLYHSPAATAFSPQFHSSGLQKHVCLPVSGRGAPAARGQLFRSVPHFKPWVSYKSVNYPAV